MSKATDKFDSKHKRIGVLGGVFDPIHHGHLALAKAAFKKLALTHLILIPSNQPPSVGKAKYATSGHIRYDMIKAAIQHEPHFEVSDIELKRQGVSYTVDTLRMLRQVYPPPTELFFLVGSDWAERLNEWKEIKTVLSLCTLVLAHRPGFNHAVDGSHSTTALEFEGINISSSHIRQQVREGKSIRLWVPETVADIIERQKLYLSSL